MTKNDAFELIPQPVPAQRVFSSSLYRQIIAEFAKTDAKSALIKTDRKSATLVQSLRKVLQTDNIRDIKIVQRSGDVYITKV